MFKGEIFLNIYVAFLINVFFTLIFVYIAERFILFNKLGKIIHKNASLFLKLN